MRAVSLFLTTMVFLLSALSGRADDIPYLTGRVNDYANILSAETNRMLTDSLRSHEMRTTNQVVILTMTTLAGANIEDFANRVFNEWKLGQKGKDNGILIIVVPDDRRMRIEVGYGLEGVMTDLTSSHIIQYLMTPRFREGDYDGGIREGTLAVLSILEGEYDVDALAAMNSGSSGDSGLSDIEITNLTLTERILIGAFVFGIIGLFTVIGILTPGFGWFMFLFLIPFWATFPIIVLGTKGALVCLISYLIIYPSAKLLLSNSSWYQKAKTDLATKGSASIGGFTFTSGGSGGSWSSGGSSGGFSGGGGRSGGGGASGSW